MFRFKETDFYLIGVILLLVGLGTLNLYSATIPQKETFFYKQLIWNIIGLTCLFLFAFYDYHRLMKYSSFLYVLFLVLLLLVLVYGRGTGGAKRWISIGLFSFQPSELMKPVMILLYSRLLSVRGEVKTWGKVFELGLYALLPALLIAKQPDLGTAVVMLFLFLVYLFVASSHLKYFFIVTFSSLGFLPVLWEFLKDYQKRRLLVFLDPDYDPLGVGYNLLQSKISLGSGGLFGVGFLKGLQHKLRFLPEHHTDFIFCVWGEEFGFVGVVVLLSLYLLLLWRMYKVALLAKDKEGFYIVCGVISLFFLHIFVNIAMTVGIIPVKGLPLPFFSYGGSATLSFFISAGLVLSVYRWRFAKEGGRSW
ncbi:MAG: rod shape-determining protein RodA [Synergistetes bacterium]|nr:MAG: Rod shape-determining protein RodA [bacterium 42_11]MBC7331307.1 rod shape-determining protein RodA [Synergistota bacterium]MDK2871257.1 rod shape determining protein RodA [bacterium]